MEILGVNHQKVYMFQASVKRKTALQKLHFCMGFVKDDGKLWEPRIVSFYCQAVIWWMKHEHPAGILMSQRGPGHLCSRNRPQPVGLWSHAILCQWLYWIRGPFGLWNLMKLRLVMVGRHSNEFNCWSISAVFEEVSWDLKWHEMTRAEEELADHHLGKTKVISSTASWCNVT